MFRKSFRKFRNYFLTGETVYDINYPFYLFTKCSGFLPITIVGDRKDGVIRSSFVDWAFFAYILGFFSYVFYVNINYDISSAYFESALINSGNKLAITIATSNSILGPMMNVKNRYKIWDCITQIYHFDLKV